MRAVPPAIPTLSLPACRVAACLPGLPAAAGIPLLCLLPGHRYRAAPALFLYAHCCITLPRLPFVLCRLLPPAANTCLTAACGIFLGTACRYGTTPCLLPIPPACRAFLPLLPPATLPRFLLRRCRLQQVPAFALRLPLRRCRRHTVWIGSCARRQIKILPACLCCVRYTAGLCYCLPADAFCRPTHHSLPRHFCSFWISVFLWVCLLYRFLEFSCIPGTLVSPATWVFYHSLPPLVIPGRDFLFAFLGLCLLFYYAFCISIRYHHRSTITASGMPLGDSHYCWVLSFLCCHYLHSSSGRFRDYLHYLHLPLTCLWVPGLELPATACRHFCDFVLWSLAPATCILRFTCISTITIRYHSGWVLPGLPVHLPLEFLFYRLPDTISPLFWSTCLVHLTTCLPPFCRYLGGCHFCSLLFCHFLPFYHYHFSSREPLGGGTNAPGAGWNTLDYLTLPPAEHRTFRPNALLLAWHLPVLPHTVLPLRRFLERSCGTGGITGTLPGYAVTWITLWCTCWRWCTTAT